MAETGVVAWRHESGAGVARASAGTGEVGAGAVKQWRLISRCGDGTAALCMRREGPRCGRGRWRRRREVGGADDLDANEEKQFKVAPA